MSNMQFPINPVGIISLLVGVVLAIPFSYAAGWLLLTLLSFRRAVGFFELISFTVGALGIIVTALVNSKIASDNGGTFAGIGAGMYLVMAIAIAVIDGVFYVIMLQRHKWQRQLVQEKNVQTD